MIIRHHVRTFTLAAVAAIAVAIGLIAVTPAAQAAEGPYRGKVVASSSLTVRSAPTSASARAGTLNRGAIVSMSCKVFGPTVGGNSLWYKLATGRWVTARFVANIGVAPRFCGSGKEYVGRVIAQPSLAIRSGPNTADVKVSTAARGQQLALVCKVDSQPIDGNPRWYQLTGDGGGQWVSARYVTNVGVAPPFC
jgi:hypothetical protein